MTRLRTALIAMLLAAMPAAADEKLIYSGWLGTYDYLAPVSDLIEKKFEEQNPGVDFIRQDVPFEKALDQATVAHLGGNASDLIHLIPGWAPALQSIGALAPLDDLFTKEELGQIPEAALNALRFEDGRLYALPWVPGPVMLFYNRNLLKQAGFSPDKPPQTWDELKKMIMGVCALPAGEGGKIYGLALRSWSNPNAVQWSIPWIYGFGGDVVDATGKVSFNTPETQSAYKWLQDVSTAGCAPDGFSVGETRNLMAAGRAGFILEGPWGRGLFNNLSENRIKTGKDADIWVAPLPKAPDGSHRTIGNSHVIAISSAAKDKKLAADFIRLILFDREITDEYYKLSDQVSTPSSLLLAQGPMGADEFTQKFVAELQVYNDNPIKHPKFYAILDQVVPQYQSILKGADIGSALATADRQIERLMSR